MNGGKEKWQKERLKIVESEKCASTVFWEIPSMMTYPVVDIQEKIGMSLVSLAESADISKKINLTMIVNLFYERR